MLIFAHRGASAEAPENTLQAFNLAVSAGVDGIEFDARQIDGEIVVIHDRRLDRTTNGTGLIHGKSLHYLRGLDAGNKQQIPVLAEVLSTAPSGTLCNIEIKHLFDVRAWLRVFDSACELSQKAIDDIIISSFNHHWLFALKQLRPELTISLLTASYNLDPLRFPPPFKVWSMNVALDVVDRSYIKEIKQSGCKALVFTVDDPDDMLMLQQWGVDGIFTNKPAVALEALG